MCSLIVTPGTLVAIAFAGPATFPTFGSQVSMWLGPPFMYQKDRRLGSARARARARAAPGAASASRSRIATTRQTQPPVINPARSKLFA